MKVLIILAILMSTVSAPSQGRKPAKIELQVLKAEDIPEGGGCMFYLAPPDGDGTEAETVLFDPAGSSEFVTIRLNGQPIKLAVDTKHKWGKTRGSYRGAWKNGEVMVELISESVSESEVGEFHEGTLLIVKGKYRRKFKIRGYCGC